MCFCGLPQKRQLHRTFNNTSIVNNRILRHFATSFLSQVRTSHSMLSVLFDLSWEEDQSIEDDDFQYQARSINALMITNSRLMILIEVCVDAASHIQEESIFLVVSHLQIFCMIITSIKCLHIHQSSNLPWIQSWYGIRYDTGIE